MNRIVVVLFLLFAGCQVFQQSPRKVSEPWPTRPSPEFCDLGAGAESFASLQAMPKSITDDFLSRLVTDEVTPQPIVERDQAFFDTDIVVVGRATSHRRFIQGGNLGSRWIIWFEDGGIVLEQHIWGYELNQYAGKPVLLGRIKQSPFYYRDRPCDEIVDFLNRRGPEPGPLVRTVGQDR